eukprot:1395839-Rhodomonas_salina.1
MALKVHFIPVRDGVDGEVGWGHNFVASAHPELLPLLLDRWACRARGRVWRHVFLCRASQAWRAGDAVSS